MCGFAGLLCFFNLENRQLVTTVSLMGKLLTHRGPDDFGVWSSNVHPIALSHQRLSILDTSFAGHQPMESSQGRYTIAFNGEIYNHNFLRGEIENYWRSHPSKNLKNISWKGRSDTETLLEAFEIWGVKDTLPKIVGMFAFSLWDSSSNKLILARDRAGEKPLYYGFQGDDPKSVFLFGSELKALKVCEFFDGVVDLDSLSSFVQYGYVGNNKSIYKGIFQVPPGQMITIDPISKDIEFDSYWTLLKVAQNGVTNSEIVAESSAIDSLDNLLRDVISGQLISDVPVGAFLSGGVDSSLVAALMQASSRNKIETFSVGFNESGFNEAVQAKVVANHIGSHHNEFYLNQDQVLEAIECMPEVYDEPFADSSQIPMYLVSHFAGQKVKVALSGDGGDEVFGGYNRHVWARSVVDVGKKFPAPAKKVFAKIINEISPETIDSIYQRFDFLVSTRFKVNHFGNKLHKIAYILLSKDYSTAYHALISQFQDVSNVVINRSPNAIFKSNASLDLGSFENYMMYMDQSNYLPYDILVKLDRAAMSAGLETRAPFLDHRIIEYAWNLPLHMKIRDGKGKWILRSILNRYVPNHLIDRPKAGFSIPLGTWLRGPLKLWAEDLLNQAEIESQGYFHPEKIKKIWLQHLTGKGNWEHQLWNILMFQQWLRREQVKL
jgi:asparagine synthase (glutamine-hydrolysing)